MSGGKQRVSADCSSFMTDKFMPMSQAVEGYDIFNKMQVQKVVFVPEHK